MHIIWRRLLTSPATRVESIDGDITHLKVDGLVCDTLCAARTRDGLLALDGVDDVIVDLDSGIATIRGQRHSPDEYDRAVMKQVAARPLRRFIEWIARACDRTSTCAESAR